MRFVTASEVRGRVAAPPSKSMTGRALAACLLADGVSELVRPSLCDDSLAACRVIEALGARIDRKDDTFLIRGTGGRIVPKSDVLDCGESGLALRMFTPVAALSGRRITLAATGSLLRRPVGAEGLLALGAACETRSGLPPVTVRGPLTGGRARIDASLTSQFLSGLLMALPCCDADSSLAVSGLASLPYVEMTVDLLARFGVRIDHDERFSEIAVKGGQTFRPSLYAVEGDWSGASFLLVAGAIAGSVTVDGLDPASCQADRSVLAALDAAGARVEAEDGAVSVESSRLRAFRFDATACPDLFPPLVALAACCEGKSVIHGVSRLKNKESDRASALSREFEKLGIEVTTAGDRMEVKGGRVGAATVEAHGDHRIAMACAVAALRAAGPVAISGDACVAKSYPAFFDDLLAIRGGR